ncbi:cation:proton antiporter [Halosolutus amylolyticus]|uniref:Cation:proton antiporter n=1 Tax=Halosolutus amylolyticus TaxID=2932267 RepID=A0ABD5PLS2_9EURY
MASEIALPADFTIILVAAAVTSVVAKQLEQPTIVAYILTGLLLGPAVLGIGTPGELTQTMSELGLAFLLFLLGVKMRIEDVRHVFRPVVMIAVPQMGLVCLVGLGTALLVGFSFRESLLIGLAVMYSSTAVVVKMLSDRDEVTSPQGTIDVGVLLVQDVVVVVLLTLLAFGRPDSAIDVATTLLTVLALVAGIGLAAIAASRYLLPVVFRRIADNEDVFFLIAIGWAFLFIFVADRLDLSIEMGAFLAGLAIAQLPYSTELQDRITPITDLFILIFFVSIGLGLEAADLVVYWREAVVASLVLISAKFWVFFSLIRWQRFSLETAFLGSANMIQVSEFALVVGTVAVAEGVIGPPVLGFLSLVALLTMSISVYAIAYSHALYERLHPHVGRLETGDEHEMDRAEYRNHAVVIGYDELSRSALEPLEAYYDDVVIIDRTVDHVETLDEAGYDVIYGDFRHTEIRKEAGLGRADFVLSSTPERDVNEVLLGAVSEETTVFVEAQWADDARELYARGAHYVVMSTQLTAERLAAYLEAYFEDVEAFEAAIETDVARLRRSEPFPETLDPERRDHE